MCTNLRTFQKDRTFFAKFANKNRIFAMDRLAGILNDADHQRIFLKIKSDRSSLEDKIEALEEQRKSQRPGKKAGKTVHRLHLHKRELFVSPIERIELTEEKISIKFCFRDLEAVL